MEDARIVLGAVGPTPIRAKATESLIRGHRLQNGAFTEELLEEAAQQAAEEIDPQSDVYGADWYKRDVAQVLLKRGLIEALAETAQT